LCIDDFYIIVATISGQWDNWFGGGNLSMFVMGVVAVVVSVVLTVVLLRTSKPTL